MMYVFSLYFIYIINEYLRKKESFILTSSLIESRTHLNTYLNDTLICIHVNNNF